MCGSASVYRSGVLLHFEEVNNIRDDFSADHSPSRHEFAVAREFFKELGSPFHVVVVMVAADRGNILRKSYIDSALEIENHLRHRLKVKHGGGEYSYSDFCGTKCDTSHAVSIFLSLFRESSEKRAVKMTFPTLDVYGHKIYLANNLFGVSMDNRSNTIEGTTLVAINFHAIYNNSTMEAIMRKWEREALEYSIHTQKDPYSLIHVHTVSEGLASDEMKKTSALAAPLIGVSVAMIIFFTVVTSLKLDPIRSKPWEALFGVLCPVLSLAASFGFLFWIGFKFVPIATVVPFLVLAIGVDDVFIFLHAWAHTSHDLSLHIRVAEAMGSAGISITITSLTNFLSFAVGILSSTPAIRIFCVFMSTAILFAYIYQIFFYTAIVAIGGLREEANLNAYVPCIKLAKHKKEKPSKKHEWREALENTVETALDMWVDFLLSIWTRIALAICLLLYWTIAGYGVSQIKVGLSSERLFLDGSPLHEAINLHRNFKGLGQMIVFVNNPMDLSGSIGEILNVLEEFQSAPNSVGPSSTQIWLQPYLEFIAVQEGHPLNFQYKYLPGFLNFSEYHKWSHYISLGDSQDCFDEKSSCVSKFFFSTGFQGAISWVDRLKLLQSWRVITEKYTAFNITIYDDFSMYADQLLTIPPAAVQTVILALVCMSMVLIVFTPNYSTIVPGVICILSINLGVFGLLFYWDIDLDPISMTTTLMAIGLSVDFVAHISFHYYKGDTGDKKQRLKQALTSTSWPMLQAAFSTVLGILVLASVRAYMIEVFVKVVVLVIVLGMVHGLIFLPIVFAAIPFTKPCKKPAITIIKITSDQQLTSRSSEKEHYNLQASHILNRNRA
ncbi:patched family domain-containing protein [Ditylenchus destructor]|uniref:Patched family domain-containing protein n=1 Tax=Ditylenchus destructor TaxID=166010 RepID=A0AAD4R7R7_9BILA|nr:patched family domain-containing protein [Ditylenchus destructor]